MEITAYELAKALHVLFIGLLLTVLIGGMAVAVLNRANPQELLARLQYRLALGLLLTAGLLVPASGLYMTQVAQFDLREFWLSSGNSVTILLALLAYAELRATRNQRPVKWLFAVHIVALIAVTCVILLMVTKFAGE